MTYTSIRNVGRGVGLATAATALSLGALAGQASAQQPSTATDGDRAKSSDTGLTTQQQAQLDRKVDRALEQTPGGKRVAPNQIRWEKLGAEMTFPLPGESIARTPGESVGTNSACKGGRVCLYRHKNFKGKKLSFYKCKFQKLRNWSFTNRTSSWVNNQTNGTKSTLFYWNGSAVKHLDSLWAPDSDNHLSGWKNDKADFLRVC